jgi:putative tryptophan/tyrosine transport system substrate-binding protein
MKRRELLARAGSLAVMWPLRASAQQRGLRRVGVLMGIAETDPAQQSFVSAFTRAMRELNWREGDNIQVDYRWGSGDADTIRGFARELVEAKPDLILGHTTPVVAALKQQTSTIPIVFTQVSDPVGSHFVDGLARPGGNITGFTNLEASMGAKLMELLKEVAPAISRIALIFNPATSPEGGLYFLKPVEVAAPLLKMTMVAAPVHDAGDIESIMASLAREPNTGLIVMPDIFMLAHRDRIIALADQYRLPAAYAYRLFAVSGGLISYGTDLTDLFRRAAPYVDRILKGEKPSDLPVQAPTKYELVINLKTAKALDLEVPISVQQRADEVIE